MQKIIATLEKSMHYLHEFYSFRIIYFINIVQQQFIVNFVPFVINLCPSIKRLISLNKRWKMNYEVKYIITYIMIIKLYLKLNLILIGNKMTNLN